MNKNTTDNHTDINNHFHELVTAQQTLLLATSSTNSVPGLSYAPFVRDEAGRFYIFVSDLAGHTANLTNNPQASVMFIRLESESRNLFARERAVFSCHVQEIAHDAPVYEIQLQALQDKFGDIVGVLRSLSDFHLFALVPETGRYVAGFGRAHTINVSNNTVSPILPKS